MLRVQYLHTTIEQMQEAWEDILLEMDSKLQKFAEEKHVSLLFLRRLGSPQWSSMALRIHLLSSAIFRSNPSIFMSLFTAFTLSLVFVFFQVVLCPLSASGRLRICPNHSVVFPSLCLIHPPLRSLLVCTRFWCYRSVSLHTSISTSSNVRADHKGSLWTKCRLCSEVDSVQWLPKINARNSKKHPCGGTFRAKPTGVENWNYSVGENLVQFCEC